MRIDFCHVTRLYITRSNDLKFAREFAFKTATPGESKMEIVLSSPVGCKPAIFRWPLKSVHSGEKNGGAGEIIETIRWVAREYVEFKPAIENILPEEPDLTSYDCIKSLCDKYNKISDMVMRMNKGTSIALKTSSRASRGLLKHIIQQVHNYAVSDPADLSKFSPFSSEDGCKTSFDSMAQLIERDQFRPKERDTFVDLASGTGHLVLQMAGSVDCKKCFGFEVGDTQASYAKLMGEKFKFWMNWFGKNFTEFELIRGNFIQDRYNSILKKATFVLIDNFDSNSNSQAELEQKLCDILKNKTQVLSIKRLCLPRGKSIDNHPAEIVEVPLEVKGSQKAVSYHLHAMNVPREVKSQKSKVKKRTRPVDDKNESKKRPRPEPVSSESYSEDSDGNVVYGPTTRKAWSEWCIATSIGTSSGDQVATRLHPSESKKFRPANMIENDPIKSSKSRKTELRKKKGNSECFDSDDTDELVDGTTVNSKNEHLEPKTPKSCLDKKRDYANKKGSVKTNQSSPQDALLGKVEKSIALANSKTVIKKKAPKEKNDCLRSNKDAVATGSRAKNIEGAEEKLGQKKLIQKQSDPKAAAPDKRQTSDKPACKTAASKDGGRVKSTSRSKTSVASKNSVKSANDKVKKSTVPKRPLKSAPLETIQISPQIPSTCPSTPHKHMSLNSKSPQETESGPKTATSDSNLFVTTLLSKDNIDKYLHRTKKELEMFSNIVQRPHSRDSLLRQIEFERRRNRELVRAEEQVSWHIKHLNERVPRVMKVHCDDLSIKSSPRNLVLHLGALLRKHQDLSTYESQLRATLQPSLRTMNPPAAHSSSSLNIITSPYRIVGSAATLDLSLK